MLNIYFMDGFPYHGSAFVTVDLLSSADYALNSISLFKSFERERDTDTDTDTGLFAKGHRPIHKTKRGLGGQGKWNIHRLFNIQLNN